MLDEARLERLISAYFDGQLAAGEKRELEAMLLGSARARRTFLDRAEWHGLNRELALRQGTLYHLADPAAEKRPTIFARRVWAAAVGLAACLALGWWLLPSGRDDKEELHSDGATGVTLDHVALLGQAIGVGWEEDAGIFAVGSALPKGWLKIREGTLRIDFYSGARVLLEGPAAFELISPDLARLEYGKLTAQVPPPAEGFTILSTDLRVVDRGTEFGMSVNESDCEVHVFDGEVELHGQHGTAARELIGGEAVAIRDGQATAITVDRGAFIDPEIMLRAATSETEARLESWRDLSLNLRSAADLLVYFDFEDLGTGGMIVPNRARGATDSSHGSVIGCEALGGRFTGKSSLAFASTSDRVRFRTEGTSRSLTLVAWVRVDSLPQDHNALLSMAPERVGEIHWKIDRSGRLLLGLRADLERIYESWERLASPPVVTERDFGRWLFLATVIDGENGVMSHFVNGEEVASAAMSRRVPVCLGMANLANFDAATPTRIESIPVRSFNGRIDEFAMFTRAGSARARRAGCRRRGSSLFRRGIDADDDGDVEAGAIGLVDAEGGLLLGLRSLSMPRMSKVASARSLTLS
jgi:hypothetical protein